MAGATPASKLPKDPMPIAIVLYLLLLKPSLHFAYYFLPLYPYLSNAPAVYPPLNSFTSIAPLALIPQNI